LQADALTLSRDGADYAAARAAYLRRFPDGAETFELGDFSIVALQPVSARLVAGFGRAYSLVGDTLLDWLRR
jgi:putative heme iron utilization protein